MNPAFVALVGASRRAGSVGAVAARNLAGFPGRVFLVNRRLAQDAAAGIYRRVEELPHAPDLAVVAVPAPALPRVIADLGKLGTRAAVVLSAGFPETQAGSAGKQLMGLTCPPPRTRLACASSVPTALACWRRTRASMQGSRRRCRVVAFDGQAVDGIDALHRLLDAGRIGRASSIAVLRRDRRLEMPIVLGGI